MNIRGYVATTLKAIALKKIPGSSRVNLKQLRNSVFRVSVCKVLASHGVYGK